MSVIAPFPHPRDRCPIATFDRLEIKRILDLYGRMVAAGHWRDYAIQMGVDVAVFAAFRRSSERPEIRIEVRDEPGPASDRLTCLYAFPDRRFLEIRA